MESNTTTSENASSIMTTITTESLSTATEPSSITTSKAVSEIQGTPGFSVWNEWSDCSKICGNGQKTRTRTCVENCDNVDSNELIDTEICNDRNCLPKFSTWNSWTDCSNSCNDGQKTRQRACIEYCDNMDSTDLIDTGTCNVQDCLPKFSLWTAWSDCSKTCSDGQKTRQRTCVEYCDDVDSTALIDTGICNEGDCPSKFSMWNAWSDCSKTCGDG